MKIEFAKFHSVGIAEGPPGVKRDTITSVKKRNRYDRVVGRIAVQAGLLTPEQLEECRRSNMHRTGNRSEETFDPTNWNDFRALAHRMVDDTIEHLAGLSDAPAWQPMPGSVQEALSEPVPWEPQGEQQAYEHFRTLVLPYANGNRHPRFFGWVQGNGTPLGMMAGRV